MSKKKDDNKIPKGDITEILEPIHHTLEELLDAEKKGNANDIEYTDNDIIAITLLYSQILGNRLLFKLMEEKAPIGLSAQLGQHYVAMINETTLAMSGVDTTKYFGRRK